MGKLKALIGLTVVLAGFYYAWEMIPPRFHNSQFQDDLDDIARRMTYNYNASEDDIKKLVISKAASDDIFLKEDQVTVERGQNAVYLTVRYRIHIDMKVYQTDLDFVTASHNKTIGT